MNSKRTVNRQSATKVDSIWQVCLASLQGQSEAGHQRGDVDDAEGGRVKAIV